MPSMEMVAALEAEAESVAFRRLVGRPEPGKSAAFSPMPRRVATDRTSGALVEAIGGGGGQSALDALASLQSAGVSIGNMGAWGGSANGQNALSMDALAQHLDAPPAA